MDSVTQAALGAAVGEAVLGRRIGNKAPIWGAVLGTVPDLDVFFNPLLSPVDQIAFHRGPSHSILFALIAAPLIAWGFARLHARANVEWWRWTWFAFLCIVTHPLLDTLTNYGTQLFWPFSDYPAAWASVAIIDPLYTLPLLIGVIVAMFVRPGDKRARINRIGLIVASAYLGLTMINKVYVDSVFRAELERQGIVYDGYMSTPTIFNNILWNGLAENDSAVWVGLYSHFDDDGAIEFRKFEKRSDLIAGSMDQPAVSRLLWFSQGFYEVERDSAGLVFNDMHVGRVDAFVGEEGAFIFRFRLLEGEGVPPEITGFRQMETSLGGDDVGRSLGKFWDRILGEEPASRRRSEPTAARF